MTRYYANLLGNWVDITDTGTVHDYQHVPTYFKENLRFLGDEKTAECFKYGYIDVQYQNKNYRIHPSCIQIVEE